jgi:hypothetical protein
MQPSQSGATKLPEVIVIDDDDDDTPIPIPPQLFRAPEGRVMHAHRAGPQRMMQPPQSPPIQPHEVIVIADDSDDDDTATPPIRPQLSLNTTNAGTTPQTAALDADIARLLGVHEKAVTSVFDSLGVSKNSDDETRRALFGDMQAAGVRDVSSK